MPSIGNRDDKQPPAIHAGTDIDFEYNLKLRREVEGILCGEVEIAMISLTNIEAYSDWVTVIDICSDMVKNGQAELKVRLNAVDLLAKLAPQRVSSHEAQYAYAFDPKTYYEVEIGKLLGRFQTGYALYETFTDNDDAVYTELLNKFPNVEPLNSFNVVQRVHEQ